jgi:hypothetical protein
MLSLVAATFLSAAPGAAQAEKLARARQWEELYLAFAAASPDGAAPKERARIAKALAQGCSALQGDDPVMAYSLGEKSVAFDASAEGLYCTGLTAKRTDQRSAAEDAFRAGLTRFAKDGRFGLELGRLYLEDGQPGEAAAALAKVPPKSPQGPEAKALLARVAAQTGPRAGEVGPRSPDPPPELAEPTRGRRPRIEVGDSLSYESAEDEEGRRVRQNQYFRFRYFSAKRDFGQRAEYEGSVQRALEEARATVKQLLGVARSRPVDVILYSREEFRLHHGPQAAQAIAGFYSADAIRMNDSAEMNERNQATLVHEYVHAVVDELTGFNHAALPTWMHEGIAEYIEWRSLGDDGPPQRAKLTLQQLALQDQLPRLASMAQGPLIGMTNPGLAYTVAAMGVKMMLARRGVGELVELVRDCGRGTPFERALQTRFGVDLARLDEEINASLRSR